MITDKPNWAYEILSIFHLRRYSLLFYDDEFFLFLVLKYRNVPDLLIILLLLYRVYRESTQSYHEASTAAGHKDRGLLRIWERVCDLASSYTWLY